MELILLQKVKNLGNLGDKVSVKPGYGRNFLVPQGKAVPATATNVAEFEKRRAEYEAKANQQLAGAEARRAQLEGASVTIKANASPGRQAVRLGRPARHRRGVHRRRHDDREERSRHGRRPDPPHRRVRGADSPARRRAHHRQGHRRRRRLIFAIMHIRNGRRRAPVVVSSRGRALVARYPRISRRCRTPDATFDASFTRSADCPQASQQDARLSAGR